MTRAPRLGYTSRRRAHAKPPGRVATRRADDYGDDGRAGRVLLLGCGSKVTSRPRTAAHSLARTVGSTLGAVPVPAYPAVVADGSAGIDAVWIGDGAVMTARWSAATQTWTQAMPLSGRIPGSLSSLLSFVGLVSTAQ